MAEAKLEAGSSKLEAGKKNAASKVVTKTKIDPILKQLLEAGAHFGQRTERWNPKMKKYIFGARSGVHIIDLIQTAAQLAEAEKAIYDITKMGGQVLFVGTKRQAKPIIEKYAREAAMPFVTHRWLGGMLTNLDTITLRIQRLKKLEAQKAENDFEGIIKKEKVVLEVEMRKLAIMFDGVRDMHGLPAAIYIVDMPKENNAILEARKLKIPVVAMADTNSDPELVTYPIASNDDAIKSVDLITGRIAAAAAKGANEYRAKAATEQVSEEGE